MFINKSDFFLFQNDDFNKLMESKFYKFNLFGLKDLYKTGNLINLILPVKTDIYSEEVLQDIFPLLLDDCLFSKKAISLLSKKKLRKYCLSKKIVSNDEYKSTNPSKLKYLKSSNLQDYLSYMSKKPQIN